MGVILYSAQFVHPVIVSSIFIDCLIVLEHGSATHQKMALDHLIAGLLDFATNEQGAKSITKAIKEGGKDTSDTIITRMCEQSKGCVLESLSSTRR
jgi:hypothetical protein